MSSNPHLSAIRATNPDALRRLMRSALAESRGDVDAAALRLKISRRTFFRWMKDLEVREEEEP